MDEPAFDLDQIRAIIALAAEADLAELTVESGTVKVSVKRAAAPLPARAATPPSGHGIAADAGGADLTRAFLPEDAALRPAALPTEANHFQPITAPMVGTFYRAPNPDAPPFVEEGDEVHPGQTVCIIEAMKLFNEIQSEVGGRVARVLAENGAPVEYGQPLFLIAPAANGG